MALKDFLFGSSGGLTSQQKPYYEQALQQGFGLGQNPLYQQATRNIQNTLSPNFSAQDYFSPFLKQFTEQTVPKIAGQFGGVGSMRGSSGLNQSISTGLQSLGEQLAAQYANIKQNALAQALQFAQAPGMQSMNSVNSLITPYLQSPQTGLLPGLGQIGAGALGTFLGGPAGGALGTGLASLLFGNSSSGGTDRAAANRSFVNQYLPQTPFSLG